ncbi:MAG: hypothetical protein IKO43_02405 [Kiritimatiellae bacterium]|nr:hypothetical protein [Kiritimatiellia bacterium]
MRLLPGSLTYTGGEYSFEDLGLDLDLDPDYVDVTGETTASSAGRHEIYVTLRPGLRWADDNSSSVVTCAWNIAKATLEASVSVSSWQRGFTPATPVFSSNLELTEGVHYVYKYRAAGESAWLDWSSAAAATLGVGNYELQAEILDSESYEFAGGSLTASFSVYDYDSSVAYPDYLGYHIVTTVTNHEGEALADFPMLVRIDAATAADVYRYAQPDASDIRFTVLGDQETVLPYEIVNWGEEGSLEIWVKVPEYRMGLQVVMSFGYVVDGDGKRKAVPENLDATDVWSDYVGVWHLGEDVAVEAAGTAVSSNSTVALLDLTAAGAGRAGTVSANGVVGRGRVANATGAAKAGYLRTAGSSAADILNVGSNFTFSAFVSLASQGDGTTPSLAVRKTSMNAANGWGVAIAADGSSVRVAGSGSTSATAPATLASGGFASGEWTLVTVVYDNESATVFGAGESGFVTNNAPLSIKAAKDNTAALAFGGSAVNGYGALFGVLDEVRFRRGSVDAAWFVADYLQAADAAVSVGNIMTPPNQTFENRWTEEPSIATTIWAAGEEPPTLSTGATTYGDAIHWSYYDVDGNELSGPPTTEGIYTLEVNVPSGAESEGSTVVRSWADLDYVIYITVTGDAPVTSLDGDTASATLGGRILLANDDENALAPVTDQSYWRTNTEDAVYTGAYWIHAVSEDSRYFESLFPNLEPEEEHWLMSSEELAAIGGATQIWHLADVRIGNTHATAGADASRVFLPHSATSLAAASEEATAAGPGIAANAASHLVMRNKVDAQIVSPRYAEGVGTVYFDAVNGFLSDCEGEDYTIVFEVATNGVEEAEAEWFALGMNVMKKEAGAGLGEAVATNSLPLNVTVAGGSESFYRVYVDVFAQLGSWRGPVRFRIRRTSIPRTVSNSTEIYYELDRGGFILIDNIVASFPAMSVELTPGGFYDPLLAGRQTVGWAGAFEPAFPSVDSESIIPRARLLPLLNSGATDDEIDFGDLVTGATIHYRRRYLGQQEDDWKTARLRQDYSNPTNLVPVSGALDIDRSTAADIEFWYDAVIKAPHYEFVDYSGLDLGVGGYSEAIRQVTSVYDGGLVPATLGTNWFVRLREGESDFEQINLVVSNEFTRSEQSVPMALCAESLWRYYYPSTTNTLHFRFEAISLVRGEDGAYSRVTNHLAATDLSDFLPSAKVREVEEPLYAPLEADISTGHFLFELGDALDRITQTRGLSVLHADYQNFNKWDDATAAFVGAYTSDHEASRKSGVSPSKQQFRQTFETWKEMPDGSTLWSMPTFASAGDMQGHALNEEFEEDRDPHNYSWTVHRSMWVPALYNNTSANVAVQLRGNGQGYIQYQNPTNAPRGIATVNFNARVGQANKPDGVTWYYATDWKTLTNYAFTSLVAFDENASQNFTGRASLSLVANYREGRGFYEARLDQATSDLSRGQKLRLFRWNYSGGKWTTTELYTRTAGGYPAQVNFNRPASATADHSSMYIAVSNTTAGVYVFAGISRSGKSPSSTSSADTYSESCWNIAVLDSSDSRLSNGTYGVLSCNCEAKFLKPTFYAKTDSLADMPTALVDSSGDGAAKQGEFGTKSVRFSGGKTLDDAITEDEWMYPDGRMEAFYDGSANWGVRACVPTQELYVCTSRCGYNQWITNQTVKVTGFGQVGKSGAVSVPVYSAQDSDLRLKTGGGDDDARLDVVIDSLEMTQWRGDDYEFCSSYIPASEFTEAQSSKQMEWYTNITFTGAWIVDSSSRAAETNMALRLSARRAPTGADNFSTYHSSSAPFSSIRSPLMDGQPTDRYGTSLRGIGLGMVSFNFANAQTNAQLVLQIATNDISQTTARGIAKSFEGWEDVATFSFTKDDLSYAEESNGRSGTRNFYVGLHGVTGMMRLIVPTNLVQQVQDVTNTTAFGEIDITSIVFRDEPTLDETAWTGWNIRAMGDSEDTAGKMFLPDPGDVPPGMSLALNDGATTKYDIIEDEADAYPDNMPYLQTPTFSTNIVGEVSFRARKYVYTSAEATARGTTASALNGRPGYVALYGQRRGSYRWDPVTFFAITNTVYTPYAYKVPSGDDRYVAFRLGVLEGTGVTGDPDELPDGYEAARRLPAVRVMIDEIAVQERVSARVGFRQVGVFRTNLDTTEWTTNTSHAVGGMFQQPLCEESWGYECEIYKANLPDEIDLDDVEVWVHWYEGTNLWGRINWLEEETGRARLAEATDSNLVFRSSYLLAENAIMPQTTVPGTIVQYALEARWHEANTGIAITNWLLESEWERPDWYNPLDLNASLNQGRSDRAFAAYNIIDSVAPGWAWINEINICAIENIKNYEENDQYIEFAVPANADLTGWYVNVIVPEGGDLVRTNLLAYFGANLPGKKDVNIESGMTYRVLGGYATDTNELTKAAGTLDGKWGRSNMESPFNASNASLMFFEPVAIQLVRPTGIVEHEVVAIGTNIWEEFTTSEEDMSVATNVVKFLNRRLGAHFFYAGNDSGGWSYSLNATLAQGLEGDWTNKWVHTPGHINEGQVIDANAIPVPNGTQVPVYASIDEASRELMTQATATTAATNANQVYFVQRGGDGIDITYTLARWHELGPLTTNGVEVAGLAASAPWTYTVNVGANASNAITVVAAARADSRLSEYLDDDDIYRPAVLDWLKNATTLKGDFANPDSEELYLADFIRPNGTVVTNLTLTEMYWLDMDPTIPWTGVDETKSALALSAGHRAAPSVKHESDADRLVGHSTGDLLENVVFSLYAMITNRSSDAAWAPYALRGFTPGATSWDYITKEDGSDGFRNWTGETFKIAGMLLGSPASTTNRNNWVDLRSFVFRNGSFDENFTTVIEVIDPHSPMSPGYEQGWKDYPGLTPGYRFILDSHQSQFQPSILFPTNYYLRQSDLQ